MSLGPLHKLKTLAQFTRPAFRKFCCCILLQEMIWGWGKKKKKEANQKKPQKASNADWYWKIQKWKI